MLTVEVWSDWACAGGTRLGVLHTTTAPSLAEASSARQLDANDALTLRVPDDDAWRALVGIRRVVRVTDALGTVREWRVRRIMDASSASQGVTQVECDPVLVDLGTCGLLRNPQPGGATWFNDGFSDLTPGQIVDTFILQNLAADGLTWLERGTIEPTLLVSSAWDRWTRLQLLRDIATKAEAEIQLRRNADTSYYLDILNAGGIGSDASPVLCQVQRNVIDLTRERTSAELCTVAVPAGAVPDGAVEPATLGYAAWSVSSITYGTPVGGQDTIRLADPAGGDGPVGFASQLTGLYLLLPAATLTEILDSTTAQDIVVAAGHGLAVGDHVEVRADSSGSLLVELENPSAVATYGRVVQTVESTSQRGERNHIRNPLFGAWPTTPWTVVGTAIGTTAGSTALAVGGLNPGLIVYAGDTAYGLYAPYPAGMSRTVQTGDTADGAGRVDLTLATAGSYGDGEPVLLVLGCSYRPTGWPNPHPMIRRAPGGALSFSGELDGDHTFPGIPVSLKSMTPGYTIEPGDSLSFGGNSMFALSPETVDGAGKAVVLVDANFISVVPGGTAVTVTRCETPGDGSANAVVLLPYSGALTSPAYTIRYDASIPMLWASAGYGYRSLAGGGLASAGADKPISIAIIDTGTGATLASAWDADTIVGTDGQTNNILHVPYQLSATTSVAVKITMPSLSAGITSCDPLLILRWVSLTLGPDPAVPPVDGSHANALWRSANRALAAGSAVPTTYRLKLMDLAHMDGYAADDEALVLGGKLTLVDARLGVDIETRIVQITEDLLQPENVTVTVETLPRTMSSMLRRVATPRLYAAVNIGAAVTTGTAGGGTGAGAINRVAVIPVPGEPLTVPVDYPGAIRAVPSGSERGATSGIVARIIK